MRSPITLKKCTNFLKYHKIYWESVFLCRSQKAEGSLRFFSKSVILFIIIIFINNLIFNFNLNHCVVHLTFDLAKELRNMRRSLTTKLTKFEYGAKRISFRCSGMPANQRAEGVNMRKYQLQA